jgi:hypothetical protein
MIAIRPHVVAKVTSTTASSMPSANNAVTE